MSEAAMPMGAALHSPAGPHVHVVRLRPATPHSARSTWLLSPAVFLIAAIATFFVFYMRTSSAAGNAPRISPALDLRSTALDLRVETQGAGLRLSWNRFSPVVAAAKSGLLEIDDGGGRRQIALDRNQIVNGSVVYRPASDDVSFRLNLHSGNGPDVAQVLRVLDAAPRVPAVEAVAPEKETPKPTHREAFTEAHADFTPRMPAPAAKASTVNNSQKTAPATQIASIPVPAVTVAQSAPPLPDGETALPKPAAPQLQQPSVVQAVPAPKTIPQPHASAAPEVGKAPTKQVPLPAYVPPRPVKWVEPDQRLLGRSNPAVPVDIRVKVKIDETGHVTAAHALIDGGKRDKKLMAAAAAVVRQWVFEPAKSHGVNVATEETIVIHLGPEAQ